MDLLLEQAALAAGLPDARAAEARDDLYSEWAQTPRPELSGQTPRRYAGDLPLADLLQHSDASSRARGGAPARVWAEALMERLSREGANGPTLLALAERVMEEPDEAFWGTSYTTLGALDVLGRWAGPGAVPVLLAGLAANDPSIRTAAGAALGRVGLPALAPLRGALGRTGDPILRGALYDALSRLPRLPEVSGALREAWQAAPPGQRAWLAEGLGRYGDPAFAPLLQAELAAPGIGRAGWALGRVALARLGTAAAPPAPAPAAADPDGDLLAGTRTLADGGLGELAQDWVQEGLARLTAQATATPGDLDWFIYEQFQTLADALLGRPPEVALQRYLDYCHGALHYYGALSLEHLMSAVSLAGLTAPPKADVLWAALKADSRFVVHPARLVALPQMENVAALLEHRDELGVQPAVTPLRSMALAARGLAHLAWTGPEEDAAQALLALLPPALAQAERIADLQAAMRGAQVALQAFRGWLTAAIDQGLEPGQTLKDALIDLWNHTARWELFGHTPWAAREIMELQKAKDEAAVDSNSPCPCGSGRKYKQCCGRKAK